MKKAISIIVAACAFIGAAATAVWYIFDDDPNTNPDWNNVAAKAEGVYDAATSDDGGSVLTSKTAE